MQKKLTITIAEDVYRGLHRVIGRGKIAGFIEELIRPHVLRPHLESAYARMAEDRRREKEALVWAETAFKGTADEAERGVVGPDRSIPGRRHQEETARRDRKQ